MKGKAIFQFEGELLSDTGIDPKQFHRVRGDQWEDVYRKVTDRFADKTRNWKNGLHWANINGYSPQAMKELLGCWPVDYQSWFEKLPQIIQKETEVYFLLDVGDFWLFEGEVLQLVQALRCLTANAFLGLGWVDYYIVSKKYRWIIGMNHHDIVSLVGEGLDVGVLEEKG